MALNWIRSALRRRLAFYDVITLCLSVSNQKGTGLQLGMKGRLVHYSSSQYSMYLTFIVYIDLYMIHLFGSK